MNKTVLYWLLQVAGWGLVFLLNALVLVSNAPIGRGEHPLLTMGLCSTSAVLVTHAWRGYIRRHGYLERRLRQTWSRYLLGTIVVAIATTAMAGVWYRLFLIPDTFQRANWIPAALSYWTVMDGVWTWSYVAVVQVRRVHVWEKDRLRAEVLAREARLEGLRKQLNPHFLFNSLNSLRALIFVDTQKASEMVDRLAALLRYSLQASGNEMVTLAEELVMVNEYLSIEKIRFEERLHVEMNIAAETRDMMLPRMLLQTLVENSVKHGIERCVGGGTIGIACKLAGKVLHLTVRNPGQLEMNSNSTRLGLKNAEERLLLLIGEDARLSIRQVQDAVEAEAWIPQP